MVDLPVKTHSNQNSGNSNKYSSCGCTDEVIIDILRTIRLYLGMDVAFISEFSGGRRLFKYVDASPDMQFIRVGASDPLEESYCKRVIDGRLPQLMRDAACFPEALELPITTHLPVGAHLSVPICLTDGYTYGTFCCFSITPNQTLDEHSITVMHAFANLVSLQIERQIKTAQIHNEIAERINFLLTSKEFKIVYQPILDIEKNRIVGFEALTRFLSVPTCSPDVWFDEAYKVGLGICLELEVLEQALKGLDFLPEDIYLSLNISSEAILSGALTSMLDNVPVGRIVLEVTEHISVVDYLEFAQMLEPFRQHGLRLAVDDAGAGYSSFRHILKLRPDVIKLDMSITRNIDSDPSSRALAAALIRFAEETGSRTVAEGVQTSAELKTLRELCVSKVQGYLIGKPVSIDAASSLINA